MNEDLGTNRADNAATVKTEDATDRLGSEMQDLNCGNDGKVDINANEPEGLKSMEREKDESEIELRLDTVPIEVFLHICSFLDSGFVLQNVSLVCKRLYAILANWKTWKIRQDKRWGRNGVYPPVPVDEETFPWSRACWKREEQIKLWRDNGALFRHVELKSHIACVDAVHLFDNGKFLATGSRDRSIIIWDVHKAFENITGTECQQSVAPASAKLCELPNAHKGWIWAFACNNERLLSASWDNTVRMWNKNNGYELVGEILKHPVACLCLAMTENVVACGTYNKKVLLHDIRDKPGSTIATYAEHKKCVLALGMDDVRVISCSEDGRSLLYDIRARKVVKAIKLPRNAYPNCLSFRRDAPAPLFYLGDRSGQIHLVNSDTFEIVQSYDVGHKQIVQGVFHSLGSVISCSKDGQLKILEPSRGLHELATLKIDAELPDVHSFNNTVALAGGDSIVRLWAPNDGF